MDAGVNAETMSVTVRLFAMLRERAGTGSLELTLSRGATVAEAIANLAEDRSLGELLIRLPIRTAVNRDYAEAGTVLAAGDELALIPPVSGGAPASAGTARPVQVLVTGEPLSYGRARQQVADPAAGAVVVFEGVTREVAALEYEAYVEMASPLITAILESCVSRHKLLAAVAEHRTGRVELGEPSVIVAVSAAHRAEAFAGAREAIDEIKAQAPIWKREEGENDAGGWVQGAPPAASDYEDVRDEASEAGLHRHRQ
jgi:MoaE-MoaD fusion protein